MYGLLNAALRDYVVSEMGQDTWTATTLAAGITDDVFEHMHEYDDSITYVLVANIATTSNTTQDTVLDLFGEAWVAYTIKEGYGSLFDVAGDNLRDFLLSLNAMHSEVRKSYTRLQPPTFLFDTVDATTLRMHYISKRSGLCPMIPGIVRGLTKRFESSATVKETECARLGAPHCQFTIVIK